MIDTSNEATEALIKERCKDPSYQPMILQEIIHREM